MPAHRLFGPAIVALLVLFVLTCGCGDYVPNHDVIVIKLHPDGTTAWTRTLDYGFDDVAGDIVETAKGDLVIAGGSAGRRYESPTLKLIRLSGNGTMLADTPGPGNSGDLTSVIITRDGNIATASYGGEVSRFDEDGRLLSTTATGLTGVWALAAAPDGGIAAAGQSWTQYPAGSVPEYDANGTLTTRAPSANDTVVTPGCRETILTAGDKKIPVTECVSPLMSTSQAAVTLLDRNGSIVVRKGYGASGLESFWSIAPAPDGGYYLSGFGKPAGQTGTDNNRYAVYLRPDGSVGWITNLGTASQYFPSGWDIRPGHIRVIVPAEYATGNDSTGVRPEVVALGPEGNVTARMTIHASRLITPTSDGGFFSAGVPYGNGIPGYLDGLSGTDAQNKLHAMKFSPDGAREWDRIVADGTSGTIRKVIQTADGGYVILSLRQNG
jgi:hypothetical protein